ncbi:MAG: squalene/phytoene synthase family protein [Gemmataceae bacterium]|nr:squalene/phytoene synthase family protein [Gemmataceae bacterium]
MNSMLTRSYRYCEEVTQREAGNFYPAFLLLPPPRRIAMCALYTFMRIADDLSDEPMPDKRRNLAAWRQQLRAALAGSYSHPAHPALAHTVQRYGVPAKYLEAVIDGVEMDLEPVAYVTFAELRNYCYHVASVVGLSCIHIWGFEGPAALRYAEDAGIAFQLTNILRDIAEDAARGRVYLPSDELAQFGYDAKRLTRGVRDSAYLAMMRFQAVRAHAHYHSGTRLLKRLSPSGRAVFQMMSSTYRGLLGEIERRDFDVFHGRVRVPGWKKALFAACALPTRFGWM